jgi:hypothetical protein
MKSWDRLTSENLLRRVKKHNSPFQLSLFPYLITIAYGEDIRYLYLSQGHLADKINRSNPVPFNGKWPMTRLFD